MRAGASVDCLLVITLHAGLLTALLARLPHPAQSAAPLTFTARMITPPSVEPAARPTPPVLAPRPPATPIRAAPALAPAVPRERARVLHTTNTSAPARPVQTVVPSAAPVPPTPAPVAAAPQPVAPQPVARAPSPPASPAAAGAGDPARQRDYLQSIMRRLNEAKTYPAPLKKARLEGRVIVSFTIAADGRIDASRIQQSSGVDALDRAALDMLVRASPLPAIPATLGRRRLTLAVPIEYSLLTER